MAQEHSQPVRPPPRLAERKTREAAAPPADARYRAVEQALRQWVDALAAIKDPIFIHDREFRIVRANRAYAACAGMSDDAFIGRPYWEVFPRLSGPLATCRQAIDRLEAHEENEEVATDDGRLFLSRSFPIFNGEGRYIHSVHIMEDITERRRIEDALRLSEEWHRQIVETSQEGILLLDEEGRVSFLNPRMAEMLGQTEEQVLGQAFLTFLEQDSDNVAAEYLSECMHDGRHPPTGQDKGSGSNLGSGKGRRLFDLRLVRKDGAPLWVMMSASPMFGSDGELLGLLGMLVDITERKEAEQRLRLAAQVFDSTAEGIMILGADGKVVDANLAFTDITGYARQEVLGRPWRSEDPQDKPLFDGIWETVRTRNRWRGEVSSRHKNGELHPELLNISMVQDGHGNPTSYVVVFSDITEIKAAQRRLEYLANHDRMTGLPNRNLFYDRLQHGLEKAVRHHESLAVMFVDLDDFKTINDTLGHEIGDMLLSQVAEHLRACTRKQDTVARLGGDEFTILAEDLRTPEIVLADTAQRILNALSAPFEVRGHQVLITASVGIAVYPENGEDVTTLLKNADTAMYQAKRIGKNSYQFFTEETNVRAVQRAALEKGLREAVNNDELSLVYQPEIELSTGRAIGLEALLRWKHPELGDVPPQQFIPVAESTGLIVPIGEWVISAVCRQLEKWGRMGLGGFRVAVNLSARQFRQKDLIETIRSILAEGGTDPTRLEIELTESAIMEDVDKTKQVLKQLKDLGMRVAIDDYGTGSSCLNCLKRFPIDGLKIDSHFTRDAASDSNDAAITAAIITMGHSLQMNVVAEGVENREQMDFLRARDCDVVQGYYLGFPLPPEQAVGSLRAN